MVNPLFQQFFGGGMPNMPSPQSPQMPQMMPSQNPMQMMANVMRAMMNPAAFVKQYFPDIPDNIQNDPNQVFNYLQQTRPQVTGQQIQQAQQTAGQIIGQGNVR